MSEINLFYGTWELDGILKDIKEGEAIELLKYAKEQGINSFDTALVYGNGKVERMLASVIDDKDIVLTKIPAKIKPSLDEEDIDGFYPEGYIEEKLSESLRNLKRKSINIVLLHNFSRKWTNLRPINDLVKLKKQGLIDKIGISIPNNFNERLPQNVVDLIDYIEVPYNVENTWILSDIDYYKENNIQIILRSLFLQGKVITDNNFIIDTLLKVKKLNVNVTIGMTKKSQIDQNIEILKG